MDTGLRVSEVCRLNMEDVNLDTGEVRIAAYGTGKKTHSRTVFIGKNSKKALWKYLTEKDRQKEDPLFTTMDNHRLTRNGIRCLLADLGKKAGVGHVHPHRFRHTAAIFFLRNGGDVFSLQRMLGHSKLDMVYHYLALTTDDLGRVHRMASPADRLKL